VPWGSPDDHFKLFEGPVGLRVSGFDLAQVPGQITFLLRAGSDLDWAVDLSAVDAETVSEWSRSYVPTERAASQLYFNFLGHSVTAPTWRTSWDRGFISPPDRSNQQRTLARAVAQWVNLPDLGGETLLHRVEADGMWREWRGRWTLDLPPWRVVLDRRKDLDEVYREAKKTSLSVPTHMMQISRSSGVFSSEDAEHLVGGLQMAFSFALGRWTAPFLIVGMDEADRPVYSNWAPRLIDLPRRDAGRWWPTSRHQDLPHYLSSFLPMWDDETEQDVLKFLVTSALAASQRVVVEQRLMTTVAAIEYLSWVDEVLGGRLTEHKWRYKKSSAQRIRRLLDRAQIPVAINVKRTPSLAAFAEDADLTDGPAVIAEIRDAVTHPKDRRRLYGVDNPIVEASRLSARYLDLLILHRIGYRGYTADRTHVTGWVGESDHQVPWMTRETG